MSDPAPITIPSTPTWAPVEARGAPNFRVKSMFEQELERIMAVSAAVGISGTSSVKRITDHSVNVFTMNADDRKILLEGPTTDIIADGMIIRKDVAVRALIASCQKVNDLIHIKSEVDWFRIYGQVDRKSIETLLDTFTTSKLLKMDRVNLLTGDLSKDVLTYQACLALGIHYSHTIPLLNALRAIITSRLLTTDELDILTTRFPASHPLIKHAANDLCHRRFRKQIPDIAEFEEWLSGKNKEVLKKVMVECDQEHEKRGQAITRRKCDWEKDSVLRQWGEDVDKVCVEQESEKEDTEMDRLKRRDFKLLA